MNPVADKYAKHVNRPFVRLLGVLGYGRVFARAKDVWIWDDEGRRYFDALAGFGSFNVGHNHPRVVRRVKEFLDSDALNVVHVGPSGPAADLAEALATLAPPLDVALFSTGGGEAVESAMKLARAATGRGEFVSCDGGFHGTGPGALSIMGDDRMRRPFEPLLDGCARVPFGDAAALEKAVTNRTAAFVVEPIQAEGGVNVPLDGYLGAAREICRRTGALLVVDEIQTGLGRTGRMLASDVVPDVLILGKSLGGGLAPVSAALTTAEIHERAYGAMDTFDLHGATFSGHALGCAAAMETLRVLADEKLAAGAEARGKQLIDGLRARLDRHPMVRDIRGRGLLVGIELGPPGSGWLHDMAEAVSRQVFGQWVALKLLERGFVCQPAAHRWNVLRLEPPLTVTAEQIDQLVDAVADVVETYRSMGRLVADVTGRAGRQLVRGWSF